MSIPVFGIIISTSSIVLLVLLYRVEAKRGQRFFPALRAVLDAVVQYCTSKIDVLLSYFRREALRQSLHYFFHTILMLVLSVLRGIESRVKAALRRNRATARRISEERVSRNKLDEIREHQVSVAMSEEEKQKHKDEALRG